MGGRDASRDMAQQLANESMQKMVVKQKLCRSLLSVANQEQKGKPKPGLFGAGKPTGSFSMGSVHKEGGGGGWGRRSPTQGQAPSTGGGWGTPRSSGSWGRSASRPPGGAPLGGPGPMGGCYNCGGAHLARDCPKRCDLPKAQSRRNLEWKLSMKRWSRDEWGAPPQPAPAPAPVPHTAEEEEDDWGLGV